VLVCESDLDHQRREVHNNDDAFHKLKFKIPHFDGKYDPDAYISWELVVEQKFTCFEFPKMLGLEQPLVNSLILLLFGRWNMARNILTTYHKLGLH
jgi:hypothetical protein